MNIFWGSLKSYQYVLYELVWFPASRSHYLRRTSGLTEPKINQYMKKTIQTSLGMHSSLVKDCFLRSPRAGCSVCLNTSVDSVDLNLNRFIVLQSYTYPYIGIHIFGTGWGAQCHWNNTRLTSKNRDCWIVFFKFCISLDKHFVLQLW
jgi:hypothetical protein